MKIYSSTTTINGSPRKVVVINHTGDDLEQGVVTESVHLDAVHHIHVLDRSGSMYSDINDLIDGVQKTIDLVDDNDIITVIWFSGRGQHRTILKGANKSEQIKKVLDSLRSTVGMTSFIDPLKEIGTVIDELGSLAQVSVNFFTDGLPQDNERDIFEQLRLLAPKVIALNTIGYGNYYNQDLLRRMSETTEFGSFVHSSNLAGFIDIFSHNYEKVAGVKAESLDIDTRGNADILYITRKTAKLPGKHLNLTRIDSQKNQVVLFGSNADDFLFEYNGSVIDTKTIDKAARKDTVASSMYSYAAGLYYRGEREESLNVLAEIGDKPLIDSHFKSFSYNECAAHQDLLNKASVSTKDRNPGSAPAGYVPAEDAFCVLDLLNILQESTSKYVPFSKNVEKYKRITREVKEEFNLFTPNSEEILTSFSKFVWNKEQLNLSIMVTTNGTVKINPASAKRVGLPVEVKASRFNNYTIIKDGALNIKSIEVLMDSEAMERIDGRVTMTKVGDDRYVIDLSSLPIVNKTYVDKKITIKSIYDITSNITSCEARQKVIGFFMDKFEDKAAGEKVGEFADLTMDKIQVLKEHGLSEKFYYSAIGAKMESSEDSDYYEARVIKFSLAGFSSFPKIQELEEKVASGKKLTPSLEMLKVHYDEIAPIVVDLKKATFEKLTTLDKENDKRLTHLRGTINGLKLAKVLTGGWFSGIEVDAKGKSYYLPAPDAVRMDVTSAYKKVYF